MTIFLQFSEKLLLELNRNVYVVEKLSSPLLVTTGTAVASDRYVRRAPDFQKVDQHT